MTYEDFSKKLSRKVLLKPDKNQEHFTWRPIHIYYNISPIYSYNEKYFKQF
jgi:hypothetical protein